MSRWVDAMAFQGRGGGPKVTCRSTFFCWLRIQLLMVEDYAYVRIDFREDPDLPIQYGDEWDDQGKKETIIHVFFCIFNFIFDFYDVMQIYCLPIQLEPRLLRGKEQ